ncbi:MAG: hypothetical protein O3B84_03435 [Chloroflexi bacterium]|nr:hypothetical protein [Chloroflexota bacterium]
MFGVLPMRVEDVGVMVPMGLMVGGHVTPVDHIYFAPADPNSDPFQYEVFAPADGFVVSVQARTQSVERAGVALENTQYRMVIEYSCAFYTIYDLMTRVSAPIQEAMGAGGRGEISIRVPVAAGDVVGLIGGHTLDLNVVDTEVRLTGFITPANYDREPWKVHSVDPFEYFDEPIRSELLEKNPRLADPRGGRIDYDIPGALVGNWFREGTNGYAGTDVARYWAGHLSIVYDLYDPTQVRVSLGDFGSRSAQFGVRGNGPDPAMVTAATGPVRYELVAWEYYRPDGNRWDRRSPVQGPVARNGGQLLGMLVVEVLAGERLRVEILVGIQGTQTAERGEVLFSDSALIYER